MCLWSLSGFRLPITPQRIIYYIDFCGASFVFCFSYWIWSFVLKLPGNSFLQNHVSFLIIGRTRFICLWSCRLHGRTSTLPGNNNHLENIMYCNTQYWWWLFDQVGMPIMVNQILCCSCFVLLSHTSPLLLVMAIIFLWHILVTHRVGKTLGTVSVIF